MKIEIFKTPNSLPIRPCKIDREWMASFPKRNPYRCNPMTVANGYGWEIYSPSTFTAIWDGSAGQSDVSGISFRSEKGAKLPSHHFGSGILTWETGFLIKTEFPYAMYINSPSNVVTKNATPLSGIVETYWLPYPFTLNWKINEPGYPIIINEGDILAQIFPIQINVFDEMEVIVKNTDEAPEDLKKKYYSWSTNRNKNLNNFQGHYIRGEIPDTSHSEKNRYSKINVPWSENNIV
jgi:hypothetical protein